MPKIYKHGGPHRSDHMAEDTQTTRICPLCKKGKLPNRTDAFVERLEKGVTEIQDLIKRLKKGNWKR